MISSHLYTIGTASSLIVPGSANPQLVTIHNHEKASNKYIYIGGSADVSTTNSIHIDPGETVKYSLYPTEVLFAVAGEAGLELGVLIQSQEA